MDRFLVPPKARASSAAAPARTAAVVPNGSSSVRHKRPTALAKAKQPSAKKYKKLSALELLRGPEPSGKKAGLSPELMEMLSRPPSRKRQSEGAPVLHQRSTENTTRTAQEEPASSSVLQRRSHTDKIKRKRPIAAAAAATAQEAGWFDIPNDTTARPASAASAPAAAAPRPGRRKGVALHERAPRSSPSTDLAPPPPPALPTASAASAPALPQVVVTEPPLPRTAAALPPRTLPPAATSDTRPEERSTAERQQRAVPEVRSRAGLMNEFFPRRVVSPSASPRWQPPSLPRGWASQLARPSPTLRRSWDYGDGEDSADSRYGDDGCDYDSECQASWDPEADHLRWNENSDEEEAEEEERGAHGDSGSSARGLSTGADHHPGVESAAGAAPEPAGSGSRSTGAPASLSAGAVAARSTARSEIAARAAAAAESRAAMSATGAGVGEGQGLVAARTEEVAPDNSVLGAVEADAEPEAADQAVAVSGVAVAVAAEASGAGPHAADEAEALVEADDARAAAEEAPAAAVPWPCRRKRGSASLFLSQRQRTGGLRCRGVGVGDGGRDTFRRQALSTVLANGLRTQRLRMGRTSNSRVAAGVVRGHPESRGIHGRVAGGVTCMEFDSQGWQLAVAGENVTVYDFDKYLDENLQLRHTLVAGARAYLQPSDGIQTNRTVSCVRWNPADEEQLAVSYLNFDEVHVYNLRAVKPDGSISPMLTLRPSSSSLSGNAGGRGHLTLEFVRRQLPGDTTTRPGKTITRSGKAVTHLVAGGKGGVFRVWRVVTGAVTELAPYLQGQVSVSPRGAPSRADVTALCCLSPDTVLIGTDSGLLATYSLKPPVPRPFRSSKDADQTGAWSLRGQRAVWGLDDDDFDTSVPNDSSSFSIQFLRLSLDHGPGVVLCGLRSGRVVVFDTSLGRALGITEPHRGASVGFCLPPAAAAYVRPAATMGEAPLTAGEGSKLPYRGGHWGPAVLACCKSSSGGAAAGDELVVLSTSARATLDSCKRRRDRGTTRSPRKSGMRPGPGWEVGEVGGGGFRVEESGNYGLCLPVEVVTATPGRSRVRLSKDVRGYLCARAQGRLLRSRLVTSSIMIGKEKHSVEAVSEDGTVLNLDRKYRGPAVMGPPGARDDGEAGAGAGRATFPRRAPSTNGSAGDGMDADDDGSEVDEPQPAGGGHGADDGSRSRILSPSSVSAPTATDAVAPPVAYAASAAAAAEGSAGSDQPWDRTWRPRGVRVFAKLEAIFGDRQQQQQQQHEDEDIVGAGRSGGGEKAPWTPFALYEVVARARLKLPPVTTGEQSLPVTAITSHPRNNFVLVGLKDGTVAAVLPEGTREKRALCARSLSSEKG